MWTQVTRPLSTPLSEYYTPLRSVTPLVRARTLVGFFFYVHVTVNFNKFLCSKTKQMH
jgi:hypothetical protein